MRHHLKHTAFGGAAVLVVLWLLGVDLRTAVLYAFLLACPLGMVAMMVTMNKSGHDHGAGGGHEHQHDHLPLPQASLTRENHERIP